MGSIVLLSLFFFAPLPCSPEEGERWRQAAGQLVRNTPNLNRSQKEAVAKAIFRRFTLWQVSSDSGIRFKPGLSVHLTG